MDDVEWPRSTSVPAGSVRNSCQLPLYAARHLLPLGLPFQARPLRPLTLGGSSQAETLAAADPDLLVGNPYAFQADHLVTYVSSLFKWLRSNVYGTYNNSFTLAHLVQKMSPGSRLDRQARAGLGE